MDEEQPLLQQEANGEQSKIHNGQQKLSKEGAPDKITFLTLLTGAFISMACESVVLSTHEQIASTFNALPLGSWLLTSYAMGYSIVLPVYGNLIDIYGCKNMLLIAYGIFAVGCTITGCGPSIYAVLAGRFITSFGGAGMIDGVSILLNNTTGLSQMAVLRTYFNLGMMLGVSCGAPLGGLLMDLVGWRWSFMIQAPIALLCLFIVAVRLNPNSLKQEDISNIHNSWLAELAKIDYLGYALQLSSLGCGVYGLYLTTISGTQQPLFQVAVYVGFVTLMILFITVELYTTKSPIFPIRSVLQNGVGRIYLAQTLLNFCQFAFLSNLSGFFIYTVDSSNTAASIPLAFSCAGVILGTFAAGFQVKRLKSCKATSLISALFALVGSALIFFRWRYAHLRWEIGYTVILCAGLGGLSSTQYISLAGRTLGKSASIITSYHVCQQIGAIVGNTLPAGLLLRNFRNKLVESLGNSPEAKETITKLLKDSRFVSKLKGSMQEQVRSAFLTSFPVIPALCAASVTVYILLELGLNDVYVE